MAKHLRRQSTSLGLTETVYTYYEVALKTTIREGHSLQSVRLGTLMPGDIIAVVETQGRRGRIVEPIEGWVSVKSGMGDAILIVSGKWYEVLLKTTLRQEKVMESNLLDRLSPGTRVRVVEVDGRRARIDKPNEGWVSIKSSSGDTILLKCNDEIEEEEEEEVPAVASNVIAQPNEVPLAQQSSESLVWRIGEEVEYKRQGKNDWKIGTITSIDPVRIKGINNWNSKKYKEFRKLTKRDPGQRNLNRKPSSKKKRRPEAAQHSMSAISTDNLTPGQYIVISESGCTARKDMRLGSDKVGDVNGGEIIYLDEIVHNSVQNRIRGRMSNGWWVTVKNLSENMTFIEPLPEENQTYKQNTQQIDASYSLPSGRTAQILGERDPSELGDNELFAAIQMSDTHRIDGLIAQNPHWLNTKMQGGFAPIHLAVQKGSMEILEKLLDAGANIDAQDNTGATPLKLALMLNRNKMFEELCYNNASFGPQYNSDGKHFLHLAAQIGNIKILNFLLYRMDVQYNVLDNYGNTALSIAVQYNKHKAVKFFTDLPRMDTSIVNREGKTARQIAEENDFVACLQYL